VAAKESLVRSPLNQKDAVVKNFLKIETSVTSGDPRNISPRSDRFLSSIGPYVSAVEKLMCHHPRLVKGRDIVERDAHMSALTSCSHFIETDYSRFDMSYSYEMIHSFEMMALLFFFDDFDEGYADSLRMLFETSGKSDIGLDYSVFGTRCSGDAHTSIGNGLVNDFMTWLCVPHDSEHFHEGDDGVIGLRGEVEYQQVMYNLNVISCLGFQLKMDTYHSIHETTFCGRFFYEDRGQLYSYCDIERALSKFHTVCSDGDSRALLLAKAMSINYTDGGTPIIGCVSDVIIRLLLPVVMPRSLKRAKYRLQHEGRYKVLRYSSDHFSDPTPAIRAACWNRTGFTPSVQIAFENYYRSFLKLGYIPNVIQRLPGEWRFDLTSHVYGGVSDFVC